MMLKRMNGKPLRHKKDDLYIQTTTKTYPMSLTGDIQSFPLAAVNRMIHFEKKTGKLDVVGDRHHATIYYKKGFIVFINSDLTQAFSLGSLLLDHNIIGKVELGKALEIAESENKRLGVVLVKLGHISQKQLVNLLRYQFKEIIATVLAWPTGTFSYAEGLVDYAEDIRFEIDPVRLLSEARQWRQYRDLIPDDRAVFKIVDSQFYSDSSFEEGILRVMLLINGERTITQIIAETGYSRLAVYKAVKQLVSRKAIVRKDTRAIQRHFDPAPLIKFYLDIIEEIGTVIALELGNRKFFECLQRSLATSGRHETFLTCMPVEADSRRRLTSMLGFIKENGNVIPEQDLVRGLDHVVSDLLADVQQLLGEKAYSMTVNRIDYPALLKNRAKHFFEDNPSVVESLGEKTSQRPDRIDNGIKKKSKPGRLSGTVGRPDADLTAILSFLSQAIHILVKDLENEIGLQAFSILQGILEGFEVHPETLSPFDAADPMVRNVERIVDCIKKEVKADDSKSPATICTQVLSEMIHQERALLGNRAVQLSLDKIEEKISEISTDRVRNLSKIMVAAIRN